MLHMAEACACLGSIAGVRDPEVEGQACSTRGILVSGTRLHRLASG